MKPQTLAALFLILAFSCDDETKTKPTIRIDVGLSDMVVDQTKDLKIDAELDATKEETPTVTSPDFTGVNFADVHLHCGALNDKGACEVTDAWTSIAENGGMGAILSVEHWTLSFTDELINQLEEAGGSIGEGDQLNELYAKTSVDNDNMVFFASVECWHDTPYGPDWLAACKKDARQWVKAGAKGFKDHAGKHWQSDSDGPEIADAGIFAGAWSRFSGDCKDVEGSTTPNRDCIQSKDIRYPLLTPEWRALVKYMVEDLKAPIVSHATTWYGAEMDCYDPKVEALRNCGELSREHLLDFVAWAEENISESARKRIIVGHTGFMLPGEKLLPRDTDSAEVAEAREAAAQKLLAQLNTVLDTGVSVETATLRDFAAMTYRQEPGAMGACILRDLFSKYKDQLLLGTDGQLHRDCIVSNYQLWNDVLTGDVDTLAPSRAACSGSAQTYGLALETRVIPQCEGEVPAETKDLFLIGNFRNLYE